MPVTPVVTSDSVIASAAAQKVYTKKKWADEWEEQVALWCSECDFCVSPSIPQAVLVYKYGEGIEPGAEPESDGHTFQQLDPKDLLRHYVKIEIYPTAYGDPPTALDQDEPFSWYGVVEESTLDHMGSIPSDQEGEERVPTGGQALTCYGLEMLLEREIIRSSHCFNHSGSEIEIGRAITFNAGMGQPQDGERRGNRSHVIGDKLAYVFAANLTGLDSEQGASEWTAVHILEYLVAYHQPRDLEGQPVFDLVLDPEGKHANLECDKPILETSGRTLRGLLDQLADRRRLHCWHLVVDEEEKKVKVRVVPFISDPINLQSGTQIKANPVQRELDFERAFDIQSAITVESMSHAYDQVIVRGAKRGCCGTWSYHDFTLERGYEDENYDDLMNEYSTAATEEEGYADLEDDAKRDRNLNFRLAEKFYALFRLYRVPLNWDGKVGDGFSGEKNPICPKLGEYPDGSIHLADGVPLWRPGLRFLRYLPFESGVEYHDNKITERQTGDPARAPDPSPNASYLPIQVMLKAYTDSSSNHRFAKVEELTHIHADVEGDVQEIGWSAHARPLEQDMGVEVNVSGAPQFVLSPSGNEWTAAEDDEVRYDLAYVGIDGQEFMRVTAMIEADEHVQAKYPTELEDLEAGDSPRILVIDVGERCRLDYVAPGTWVGLKDGRPQQTTNGGFVRDDRIKLQDLARIAAAWYLVPRQAFSLAFKQIRPIFDPGDLIVTIKQGGEDVEVNSLVTRIQYNFDAQTTAIQTDFAELDVGAF